MPEDDRRGIVMQGTLQDLAWVHSSTIHGTSKQLFVADQPVTGVEEQATEHLVGQIRQPGPKVAYCILRGAEGASVGNRRLQVAPAGLQGCLDPGDPGRPEAWRLSQSGRAGRQHAAQVAASAQQPVTQLQRILTGCSMSKQNGEQFAVRQASRSIPQQFFPRPLRRRPVTQSHIHSTARVCKILNVVGPIGST